MTLCDRIRCNLYPIIAVIDQRVHCIFDIILSYKKKNHILCEIDDWLFIDQFHERHIVGHICLLNTVYFIELIRIIIQLTKLEELLI